MRSIRGALVGGIALCAAIGSGACHRRAVRAAPTNVAPDSATGTLAITGTTFEQQFVLRSSGVARPVRQCRVDRARIGR
jgi:hypothetical protein